MNTPQNPRQLFHLRNISENCQENAVVIPYFKPRAVAQTE
jgi:hypothetical protein